MSATWACILLRGPHSCLVESLRSTSSWPRWDGFASDRRLHMCFWIDKISASRCQPGMPSCRHRIGSVPADFPCDGSVLRKVLLSRGEERTVSAASASCCCAGGLSFTLDNPPSHQNWKYGVYTRSEYSLAVDRPLPFNRYAVRGQLYATGVRWAS